MIKVIKDEKDTTKTPKLFAELDKWLNNKEFKDYTIYKMDKKIKMLDAAEEKGIREIKS